MYLKDVDPQKHRCEKLKSRKMTRVNIAFLPVVRGYPLVKIQSDYGNISSPITAMSRSAVTTHH
jgi:hypothetical protein